jgi:cation transport ATPase
MLGQVRSLLLFILFTVISADVFAGFGQVLIGVNGLTCSQCTRNVEMRIRRLPFIAEVTMNLEHTNGVITIKEGSTLDPSAIAKAVRDAGFSVRFLKASYTVDAAVNNQEPCFKIKGNNYQLVPADAVLQGQVMLQFIGADFMPAADLKPWKSQLVKRCQQKINTVYFVNPVNETTGL